MSSNRYFLVLFISLTGLALLFSGLFTGTISSIPNLQELRPLFFILPGDRIPVRFDPDRPQTRTIIMNGAESPCIK